MGSFQPNSETERNEIFKWLSNGQYRDHHKSKVKAYLRGSGNWLFEKKEFVEWRKATFSSILWLHGIRKLLPIHRHGA
jgi:hypothetical protein